MSAEQQRRRRRRRRQSSSRDNGSATTYEQNYDIYSAQMAHRVATSHKQRIVKEQEVKQFIHCLVRIDSAVEQGQYYTTCDALAPRFCKRLRDKGYKITKFTGGGPIKPSIRISWSDVL